MYPDDPKLNRFTKPSTREQILVVLIAVGVAVVVTVFAGVFLFLARSMQ